MSQQTQRIDLDALEAALAKSTPGEWTVDEYGGLRDIIRRKIQVCGVEQPLTAGPAMERSKDNTEAIALTHNALPALIAELRELRAETERLHYMMKAAGCWCPEGHSTDYGHTARCAQIAAAVAGSHALPMPEEVQP